VQTFRLSYNTITVAVNVLVLHCSIPDYTKKLWVKAQRKSGKILEHSLRVTMN